MTATDPSEFPDPPRAEGMGRCLAFGLPIGLAGWFVLFVVVFVLTDWANGWPS